jgi:hypothetical protein
MVASYTLNESAMTEEYKLYKYTGEILNPDIL